MARIPEVELERLKAEVSVERLVEAAGIALTKSGKDRLGKCPFHEDGEPSLRVTPEKNLWHCFGCGTGGGPIDWVMRMQGISFRHAVELLKADLSLAAEPVALVKQSSIRRLPPPVVFDADDQALLNQTIAYYHETLKASPEALDYLKARGIHHPEAIERFKLGYANRTLGYSLPIKQVKAGGEIRGRLEKLGIYRDSGHEHFNGSLVIPVLDEAGNVLEVYGRKILNNLRKGTPLHLYLPGPHQGVWNVEAMRESKEIILCEALIDALTFWCAGYRNVTTAYGVEGFGADHLEAFERTGTERVLIAFDRDEAGDRAAEKIARRLMDQGIACYRLQFPKGMDANAYALKVQPAAKALGLLIRTAEWMGSGAAPKRPAAKEERIQEVLEQAIPAPVPSLAAAPQAPLEAVALPASVKPPAPGDELPHEIQGQDLLLTLGERCYRVRGWQKPLNPETLKVNLMVTKGEHFHVDTLDLYQAKARAAFIRQASLELSESEESLKLDLGKVLRKVEAMQAEQLAEALAAKNQRPALSETEHAEALSLLKAPDLLPRILSDFEALGIVGEEPNKITGYLAAVSRLLDRPLALLIQSASAAGKSSLMDAVLDLVPEEDVVRYSAMSGQSLFYMGDRSLQHKILAIAEEEGAKQASYALKLLQSEGRVTMASTGKDPATGMLVTHDYTVEGPVMLFLTTTAIDLDEELLNRCLVLTVNESREQTRAIHTRQRSRETLEGLLAKTHRDQLIALHRNAQRLLQPLAVVNPFAGQLSFRDDQTRSRRDHVKYLTLIRSIALLHQFQREVQTHGSLRYIEVIPSDIELANELAHEVLGRTVDELLPQTRKLLTLLHGWMQAECEQQNIEQADFHFTRRQAREATGWGDTQLRIHLDRLVEMEFLLTHRGRRGQTFDYELLYQGDDAEGRARLLGLIDFTQLQPTTTTATSRGLEPTSRGEDAHFAAPSRGGRGGVAGGSRPLLMPFEASTDEALRGIEPSKREKPHPETHTPVLSYLPSFSRRPLMPRKGQKRPPKAPVGDVRDPDSFYHHMLRYLSFLAEKNYSPRTVENRDACLRSFIAWCDERGLTRPQQLDRPILERYQRHLFYYRKKDGEPLSARSQHVRIIPLRHWLQWLVRQGHLLYSPAADLELPRLEKRLPKAILSAKEAEMVLAVPNIGNAVGLRDRAILETFYSTGIRRMELIGLHVHHVDFERGTVMIRQGKGKKDRMIPIGERALAWIEKYRDSARPELVSGRDDGTLFLSNLGGAFTRTRLTQLVRNYVDKAAIGKSGACHLFRHTMATLMLENGADIRFIQAMLGHASLDTTQIYAQVSIRMLKAIHTATHPGKFARAGQHTLEAEHEPTAEDILAALDREAEEEGEE